MFCSIYLLLLEHQGPYLLSTFMAFITPQHKPFCIQTTLLCIEHEHLLTVCKYPNSFLSFKFCPSYQKYFFQIHLLPTFKDYIEDSTPH